MKRTPPEQRRFHADRARDAFLRAAASLTEPRTTALVAFALLEGAIGLMELAKSDTDRAAQRHVEHALLEAIGRAGFGAQSMT